jgi:hypothetical protein
MPIHQPPWIAWANRSVVTIPTNMNPEGHALIPQSFQLSSATVGRPITWSFFFLARILQCEPAQPSTVTVDFNVTTGIGQAKGTVSAFATTTLQPGFCRMVFVGNPLDPNGANALKWTSAVPSPELDDASAISSSVTLDRLVAERVECNASVFYESNETFVPLLIELFAGFAPYNMRDEWFADLEAFG